jgi:hypothetical protein
LPASSRLPDDIAARVVADARLQRTGYHFFFAVSVGMFGMTVGNHRPPETRWFPPASIDRQPPRAALLASLVPAFWHPDPLAPQAASSVLFGGADLFLISVPFVFSGIVVSLALTRFRTMSAAADLIGASLACLAFVICCASPTRRARRRPGHWPASAASASPVIKRRAGLPLLSSSRHFSPSGSAGAPGAPGAAIRWCVSTM